MRLFVAVCAGLALGGIGAFAALSASAGGRGFAVDQLCCPLARRGRNGEWRLGDVQLHLHQEAKTDALAGLLTLRAYFLGGSMRYAHRFPGEPIAIE